MKIMNTPESVDISITSKCNLRCGYCSHLNSDSFTDNELSTEEWLNFFDELKKCTVLYVCLQGGEPFFRQDLPILLDSIVKNRMRYSILTNGTLITDELAKMIAQSKRCDSIQVSIDGSKPETHDSMRGKGNFIRAVEGINLLRKHDVPVQVRVTLHKGNVRDLEAIAKFLLEEMRLSGFSTNAAGYMGLCRQNSEYIQLDADERTLAMESLINLNKKYPGRITGMAGPLAEAKVWNRMVKSFEEGIEPSGNTGYLTGCGCVYDKIAVRPDGVIVPCILLSHIHLGNVKFDSLKEVWQFHPEIKRIRERKNIPLDSFSECRICKYMKHCTGNCAALAYTISGDIYQPSPDACLHRFLEDGGVLPKNFFDQSCNR